MELSEIIFIIVKYLTKKMLMKQSMLEYTKTILEKVSFNLQLFEKELKKSLNHLVDQEILELQKWIAEKFGRKYDLIALKR